jgi:hypothetical protein
MIDKNGKLPRSVKASCENWNPNLLKKTTDICSDKQFNFECLSYKKGELDGCLYCLNNTTHKDDSSEEKEFKALIHVSPVYKMTLNKDLVSVLLRLSRQHYDGVCRSASAQGGFLYGWNNCVDFESTCDATFRELDLTLKIMEMYLNLSPEDVKLIDRFRVFIHKMIKESEDFKKHSIQFEL